MPKSTVPAGTNLAVLVGTLTREPELRSLPSGDTVLALEVTVHPPGGAGESAPITWFAAPARAAAWLVGEELLVIGRVRRRFFRAGGTTQSRTEVVAARVVPIRSGAACHKALTAALDPLRLEL